MFCCMLWKPDVITLIELPLVLENNYVDSAVVSVSTISTTDFAFMATANKLVF